MAHTMLELGTIQELAGAMRKTIQQIERVHQPSPALFYQRFVKPNRPVVLTGLIEDWKAISKWTPAYLRDNYPDAQVAYTTWDSSEAGNDPTAYYRSRKRRSTTLGQFISAMPESGAARNYISQFPILKVLPQLAQDIQSLDEFMSIPSVYPAGLQKKLKRAPTLWLGPAGIVTPVHFDSAHNLLVQIRGHKKLILISPRQSKLLYYPRLELGHVNYSPVDVEHPDLDRFPAFSKATTVELELAPGEVLFIPVRWWHYARALEQTISLNFWWFSIGSLRRMWHPYLIFKMSRLWKKRGRFT